MSMRGFDQQYTDTTPMVLHLYQYSIPAIVLGIVVGGKS